MPAAIPAGVVTVSWEAPAPPVTVAGLKLADAPTGRPVTARATSPVNPFNADTVTA